MRACARRVPGPDERRACRPVRDASHRDAGDDELVGGPRRRRERRRVELGQRPLGFVQAPDQQQAPDAEIARVRGVREVAVRLERLPRGVERVRRPAQIARGERDLRFGDDAARASHRLLRAEGASRAPQSAFARTRSPSCASAMPRNASAGASSRSATRFNAPSGSPAASARAAAVISESIGNPATLVTPTVRRPPLNLSHGGGRTAVAHTWTATADPQGDER